MMNAGRLKNFSTHTWCQRLLMLKKITYNLIWINVLVYTWRVWNRWTKSLTLILSYFSKAIVFVGGKSVPTNCYNWRSLAKIWSITAAWSCASTVFGSLSQILLGWHQALIAFVLWDPFAQLALSLFQSSLLQNDCCTKHCTVLQSISSYIHGMGLLSGMIMSLMYA